MMTTTATIMIKVEAKKNNLKDQMVRCLIFTFFPFLNFLRIFFNVFQSNLPFASSPSTFIFYLPLFFLNSTSSIGTASICIAHGVWAASQG